MKEVAPEALAGGKVDLGDLVVFYKKSKVRFDEDDTFKETSRKEVVKLQARRAACSILRHSRRAVLL